MTKVPEEWARLHRAALRSMLDAEARLLARLRAAVRLAVWQHRRVADRRAAAHLVARDLRAVLARVIVEGRREARRRSRDALVAEVALARAQGAGPIPDALEIAESEGDAERARAVAESYAKAWLAAALAEIEAP